ncbi:MAG TPA: zinc finger domain-containing protein, partial [Halomonas sp.]|nr:zinc finger domain-containing protein [Halomonas sp.]
ILSFTAEEIFENIPGERAESVLLAEYYTGLSTLADDAAMGRDFWEQVLEVKQAVNKCLEDARNAKTIKGSLAAEVTLFVSGDLHATLAKLGDELRFVMLTSDVRLAPLADATGAETTELEGLKVAVTESPNRKCERCWHHREDVGTHPEHSELCGRCISNLPNGPGETRFYA